MNTGTLNFAANLSMLYGHLPLLQRPAAAAAAGFTAAEIWWPFDSPFRPTATSTPWPAP